MDGTGFVIVPRAVNDYRGASPSAMWLWVKLKGYAWQDGYCEVGYPRLCADLGRPERTVRRFMAQLVAAGLVEVVHQGRNHTNRYLIYDRPKEADQDATSNEDDRPNMTSQENGRPLMADQTEHDRPNAPVHIQHDRPKKTHQNGSEIRPAKTSPHDRPKRDDMVGQNRPPTKTQDKDSIDQDRDLSRDHPGLRNISNPGEDREEIPEIANQLARAREAEPVPPPDVVWAALRPKLVLTMNPRESGYLLHLRLVSMDEGSMRFRILSEAAGRWVDREGGGKLERALAEALGAPFGIEFERNLDGANDGSNGNHGETADLPGDEPLARPTATAGASGQPP